MKLIKISLITLLIVMGTVIQAQVAVNNTGNDPDADAMLDVQSTNKGLLVPRMIQASRPDSPPAGMIIYQTDNDPGFYTYGSAGWKKMGITDYDFWKPNAANIYFNSGRVAVGTDAPDDHRLNVVNYLTGKAAVRGANQSGSNVYAEGYLGVLSPNSLGIPVSVINVGVLGIKPANGNIGAAIYGWNNDDNSLNYAGIFVADGTSSETNYGLYASASGSSNNYAGYFTGRVDVQGNSTGTDAIANVISSTVNHTTGFDTRAIHGYSIPSPGWGYGVHATGGYIGVKGIADATSSSFSGYGVYGDASGDRSVGTHYGLYGNASGTGGVNVGVYGGASGGTSNWAGYFSGDAYISSDLRIGTTTQASGYSLSINGKIACEEVLVQDFGSWPDYVFNEDYNLMSLEEVEKSIKKNKHLPGIPAASDIEENGLQLGNMQKLVIEKLEELTLYTIEQGKMIEELKNEIELLKAKQ